MHDNTTCDNIIGAITNNDTGDMPVYNSCIIGFEDHIIMADFPVYVRETVCLLINSS